MIHINQELQKQQPKQGLTSLTIYGASNMTKKVAAVTAEHNLACCLMHNRKEPLYDNFLSDVVSDLKESLDIAEKYGIDKAKSYLTPV